MSHRRIGKWCPGGCGKTMKLHNVTGGRYKRKVTYKCGNCGKVMTNDELYECNRNGY